MQTAQLSGAAKARLTAWELKADLQRNAVAPEQPVIGDMANSLAGLLHDARNIVAAMDLYCDLLAQPEVLSAESRHYAADLRLVSGAGRRLLDKLAITAAQSLHSSEAVTGAAASQQTFRSCAAADATAAEGHLAAHWTPPHASSSRPAHQPGRHAPTPVWPAGFRPSFPAVAAESTNVERACEELRRILPLLSAVAGPRVSIKIAESGQDWPLPLSAEDLTRIMVNLVRNASEAMAGAGSIQIALEEIAGFVVLSVADEGPGIPRELMEQVFQAGFSTRESQASADASGNLGERPSAAAWPVKHRGLGLSIVRSIVSAARGAVWAANRAAERADPEPSVATAAPNVSSGGAVLFLEFPLPHPGSSH